MKQLEELLEKFKKLEIKINKTKHRVGLIKEPSGLLFGTAIKVGNC